MASIAISNNSSDRRVSRKHKIKSMAVIHPNRKQSKSIMWRSKDDDSLPDANLNSVEKSKWKEDDSLIFGVSIN